MLATMWRMLIVGLAGSFLAGCCTRETVPAWTCSCSQVCEGVSATFTHGTCAADGEEATTNAGSLCREDCPGATCSACTCGPNPAQAECTYSESETCGD
jgi:hypothetical protein